MSSSHRMRLNGCLHLFSSRLLVLKQGDWTLFLASCLLPHLQVTGAPSVVATNITSSGSTSDTRNSNPMSDQLGHSSH